MQELLSLLQSFQTIRVANLRKEASDTRPYPDVSVAGEMWAFQTLERFPDTSLLLVLRSFLELRISHPENAWWCDKLPAKWQGKLSKVGNLFASILRNL